MIKLQNRSARAATSSPDVAAPRALVVAAHADLDAIRAEWTALYDAIPQASPCASPNWICAWWETYGQNPAGAGTHTHPVVISVHGPDGSLVAIVPCFEERPRSPFRIRRLRHMGDLGHDPVFSMTEEPPILVRPGHETAALAAIAEFVRRPLSRARWDLVALRLFSDDPTCPFRAAFRRFPAWRRSDRRSGSDYATLPETWDAYRKQLTRSMRDNLSYYPRLLTREGHTWEVRVTREPASADRLADLHQARSERRTGVRHCNHLPGPTQVAFLRRLIATSENAFIAELVADGEVVASQAFIESGPDLMVYYSGYAEAWARYSPIFVIDTVVFRDAHARGVRRLNFLRNPGQWKSRWGAVSGPPLRRITLVTLRPDGMLRYAGYFLAEIFRRHVTERVPNLWHDFRAKLIERRDRSIRQILPWVPVLGRLTLRASPTLHWALGQVAVHHHVVAH